METVELRNGAVEATPLVTVAMMSLRHLMNEKPLALYDLVMVCRDSSYEWFGDNLQESQNLSLVQPDGKVHESIRNIVLAAVTGDGLDMRLESPVKRI